MAHRITLAEVRSVCGVSLAKRPRRRRDPEAAVAFLHARAGILNQMGAEPRGAASSVESDLRGERTK